jgi:hypothetical protein
MVIEIVFLDLPKGTKRAELMSLYHQSSEQWIANPDLVHKYYFFDEDRSLGGGVYVWRDRAAAERWHGEDYRQKAVARYGTPPRIEILDAMLHVDPIAGRVTELS